jgi:hypothetical protein
LRRDRSRNLARLKATGITTAAHLVQRLLALSPSLKGFGIELVDLCGIHRACPVLIELISDARFRLQCADVLSRLNSRGKATEFFLKTARRELESDKPDKSWLEAVILGVRDLDDPRAEELLVEIFERPGLPGWLRGDAGDKLGFCAQVLDRWTVLYRRCRAAARRGLDDDSIDVQFWSMYVIGSLVSNRPSATRHGSDREWQSVLPKLRRIAKRDHRFAPGYWWPMSVEAADVIACIETGGWPNPDAAERFPYSGKRGPSRRE